MNSVLSRLSFLGKLGLHFVFTNVRSQCIIHKFKFFGLLEEVADSVFQFSHSVNKVFAVFARWNLLGLKVDCLAGCLLILTLCDSVKRVVFSKVEVFVEVLEQTVASAQFREAVVVQLAYERTQVRVAEVLGEDLGDESLEVDDYEAPSHRVPLYYIGQNLILGKTSLLCTWRTNS